LVVRKIIPEAPSPFVDAPCRPLASGNCTPPVAASPCSPCSPNAAASSSTIVYEGRCGFLNLGTHIFNDVFDKHVRAARAYLFASFYKF
jgi:hypothetical protein